MRIPQSPWGNVRQRPPPRDTVQAELEFHIEGRVAELVALGFDEEDARRDVVERFGDVDRIYASCRAIGAELPSQHRRERLMESLLQDVKFAARTLRKAPGFAMVAILTVALGIGANSAIFSVVNAVLLRELPFGTPEDLVMVWLDNRVQGFHEDLTSYPNFVDLRDQNRTLSDLAAFSNRGFSLTGVGDPERLRGAAVSAKFFDVMQVAPLMGRTFRSDEDQPGSPPLAILSHGLWVRRFGGETDLVGRTINLDGAERTVVGVMPPGFDFPDDAELWTELNPTERTRNARGALWLWTVGRLAPDASLEQARTDLNGVITRVAEQFDINPDEYGITVNPLHDQLVGDVRTALWVLLGAVGLVLLIACVNVANLILAKASARESEMAVRAALGAGRGRIIRQLLTESIILALVGAPLGVLMAVVGLNVLTSMAPPDLPRLDEVRMDGQILAFTAALTILSAFIFGLLPAFHAARSNLGAQLRQGASAVSGRSRNAVRRGLIVAEIAIAVVLLVGAGLLIRSFNRIQAVDVGFEVDGVATMRLTVPSVRYEGAADVMQFYARLTEQLGALPQVRSVGLASSILVGQFPNSGLINIEGRPPLEGAERVEILQDAIDHGLFPTLGVPLVRGRMFNDGDAAGQPRVAVINETMASLFWPDGDPIGQRVIFGPAAPDGPWLTIVGVVGDMKRSARDRPVRAATYIPHAQSPRRNMTVVASSDRAGADLLPALRRALWSIDPDQPVSQSATMKELLSERTAGSQFNTTLLTLFAVIALLLAAAGVYGVMAYFVSQRTRELGVRIALGAGSADVVKLVVGSGMRLAAIGIAVGIVLALALSRSLSSLLFNVSTFDPVTLSGVVLVLGVVALVACLLPAQRATRVDSMTAIRTD
jgi:putative ABC transport system permease protein